MNQRNRMEKRRSMSLVSKSIIFVFMVACIFGVLSLVTNFISNNNVGRAPYTGNPNNPITVYGDTGADNTENNTTQRDIDLINAAENSNSPNTGGNSPTRNSPYLLESAISLRVSEITNTRYLELVNHKHGIGVKADSDLIVDAWPTVPVRTTDITLHISARAAVSKFFEAARNDNSIGTFFVSSGYRDIATQEQLYNSGMDRSLVLPPGHSEHHTGLGIDILAVGIGQFELGNSAEGLWLAENSWRFGLILRYPKNKENITGIAYEPWHFRYVGQPHAWYMWQNDMVLEEYIEFLRETGGYTTIFDGREYTILHQVPMNGMIYIPQNADFIVSSDNINGYIITSW
jgi:D-alanyl-D-alanine carboxypeptidase